MFYYFQKHYMLSGCWTLRKIVPTKPTISKAQFFELLHRCKCWVLYKFHVAVFVMFLGSRDRLEPLKLLSRAIRTNVHSLHFLFILWSFSKQKLSKLNWQIKAKHPLVLVQSIINIIKVNLFSKLKITSLEFLHKS